MAGFEQLRREYVALLQRPHTDAELGAMEARKAASRTHFDRVSAAYRAQTERKKAAVAAVWDALAADSPAAGPLEPAAGDAEQASLLVDGAGSRAEPGPATVAAPQPPGAGGPANPESSLSDPAVPSAEALQRARARDRARRALPPVPPYDDSDYEEGSPAGASSEGVLGLGSGGGGSHGSGSRAATERGRAGGEGRVKAGTRGVREPGSPGAGNPDGGGEFEAGAVLDARSAAELERLDTYQQAQEAYPAWEEELFGSPAGALNSPSFLQMVALSVQVQLQQTVDAGGEDMLVKSNRLHLTQTMRNQERLQGHEQASWGLCGRYNSIVLPVACMIC